MIEIYLRQYSLIINCYFEQLIVISNAKNYDISLIIKLKNWELFSLFECECSSNWNLIQSNETLFFFSFPIFVVLRYGDNSQANRNFESKTFLSFFKVIVVYKWNLYLIFCWVKRRHETTLHDIIPNNISNPKNIERATIPQKL